MIGLALSHTSFPTQRSHMILPSRQEATREQGLYLPCLPLSILLTPSTGPGV